MVFGDGGHGGRKKTLELVHMKIQPEYGDRDENELWEKNVKMLLEYLRVMKTIGMFTFHRQEFMEWKWKRDIEETKRKFDN